MMVGAPAGRICRPGSRSGATIASSRGANLGGPPAFMKSSKSTAVLVDFDDFMKAGGPPKLAPRLEAIVAPEREPGLQILPAGAPTIMHWLMVYTRRVALLF